MLDGPALATIDILLPAYQTRARQNVTVGDITTIEVAGLADALRRTPVAMELDLTRSNGVRLEASVVLPDEPAALGVKSFAWVNRGAGKDAVDIWRCLEVCNRAGVSQEEFTDGRLVEVRGIINAAFADLDSPGMKALTAEKRLSAAGASARHTRIRALAERVLG